MRRIENYFTSVREECVDWSTEVLDTGNDDPGESDGPGESVETIVERGLGYCWRLWSRPVHQTLLIWNQTIDHSGPNNKGNNLEILFWKFASMRTEFTQIQAAATGLIPNFFPLM